MNSHQLQSSPICINKYFGIICLVYIIMTTISVVERVWYVNFSNGEKGLEKTELLPIDIQDQTPYGAAYRYIEGEGTYYRIGQFSWDPWWPFYSTKFIPNHVPHFLRGQ